MKKKVVREGIDREEREKNSENFVLNLLCKVELDKSLLCICEYEK